MSDLRPLGRTGLKQYGGRISEEWLQGLTGNRAVRVYREMADNSAIVGAVLYLFESLLKQVDVHAEPADDTLEASEAADFLDDCMESMAVTWEDLLSEILTMLPYGWALFETVYTKRPDGRIGWAEHAIRAQDTLDRWQFSEETGELEGMHQFTVDGHRAFLPIDRCLLFRLRAHKRNPEGRSILRNAYRSWFFCKRLEEIEAIGIERDLAGLPVLEVPPSLLHPSASAAEQSQLSDLQDLIQQIRRDEREGAIVPAEQYTDSTGATVLSGYKLKLLTSGGGRSFDVGATIRRYQTDIAMSMLSEVLMLGGGETGSWALASSKTKTLAMALDAIMGTIVATLNVGVKRLMRLNGIADALCPKLVHGDIESPELGDVAAYVAQLVSAGVMTPDDELERKLRGYASLPMPEAPKTDAAPKLPVLEPVAEEPTPPAPAVPA